MIVRGTSQWWSSKQKKLRMIPWHTCGGYDFLGYIFSSTQELLSWEEVFSALWTSPVLSQDLHPV